MAPTRPNIKPRPIPSSLSNPYKHLHEINHAPTKRLKRESKHATLLSRISKTAPGSKVSKRRRPSKKLVAGLEDLADALPDATDDNSGANKDRKAGERHDFKIKHRSFKTRPGALKKKEKLVAMEMDRFKKNMALMAAGSTIRNQESEVGNEKMSETHELERNQGGSRERWAAIRSFISQTMERRPDGEKLVEKG